MAIQKMVFLKIICLTKDMHEVLKKLVLSESLHLDFENADAYDNSYMIHEYESVMADPSRTYVHEDDNSTEIRCDEMEKALENLGRGLSIELKIDKKSVTEVQYGIKDAHDDLNRLIELMGSKIDEIAEKRAAITRYEQFKEKINFIQNKNLDPGSIARLNYFDYEIGALSSDNRAKLKKNYENISAVVLNIGTIKYSVEDLYIIIFPSWLRDETSRLLKSMNWVRLDIPGELTGTIRQMIEQADEKINALRHEIDELTEILSANKEETVRMLNRIYTTVKLEKKILNLEHDVVYGESSFVLNAWIREDDKDRVKKELNSVTEKIIVTEKAIDKIDRNDKKMMPPTQFRNNWLFKPFEMIIRLYGLPSYHEIDPTPFIAVTFCLMFGIMFGDIGQGLIYFIAGLLLYKKSAVAGGILTRLGTSSAVFGFIYGSLFGLEQAELPWLSSLTGRPLDPRNIPTILLAGVIFGVVVLTVSFIFGIFNSLRKGDVEAGIFSRNGITGYIFFISLVLSAAAVTGAIGLPTGIPLLTLLLSLIIMLAKEPLANLVLNKRPLIHGSVTSYLTESIFEGVETVLGTLSNAISFIRVGAFALNHAGLFLAFLVMSEMMPNIVLKIIILILGNVLILTLEGLIVFIQGLRLQYYEMFGKYFQGGGIEFNPVRIDN